MTGGAGGVPVHWVASDVGADDEAGALSEVDANIGITGLRLAAWAVGAQVGCQARNGPSRLMRGNICKWCVAASHMTA
eukprot:scaffold3766_cov124-Isochrysis_galbana.AAC.4